MKHALKIVFVSIFFSLHFMGFATHIVGGTLTYVHNGGSSYTVTLKLYRDCTGINFPGSVTISVLGNNGASFSTSKDFTMNLGTVTAVPSTLPACSTPPNPLPCTQEGIYTKTVTNLPPNIGGYHMYYQTVARNYSLTNINSTSATNIGESFYAYIPGYELVWGEDFTLANGTTVDNGTTAWSLTAGSPAPATANVNNSMFEITGANNAQETWTSQTINISAATSGVTASINLYEAGTLESTDSIKVYYSLNGGALTLFSTNGSKSDDFDEAIASQSTLIGSTLQIVIKVRYSSTSPSTEIYRFDNILVNKNDPITNSNPTFTNFPPLFICNGEALSFDHSATDADGDSLAYSFYTPYDGDNNTGPKDPTFSGNTAVFTPVVFLGGYSTNNPLGGTGLSISSTGLLTGTPAALGQYVVGVKVKEYRNGVYLDETLRDFQFNVVTCSAPLAIAIISPDPVICFGSTSTTISANPSGGSPPYAYLWNNTNPSQSINVGVGTYTVKLTDAQNCAPVYATATVTAYTVAVSANAGTDQTVCNQSPTTTLNGAVFGPSTGIWSGGTGTFSPDNTSLSATYTPSAAELTNGFVDLTLTTTGSGSCPSASDVVRINYVGFLGTLSVTPTNISCYGMNNGAATVSNAGGSSPYKYFWTNSNTTATITGLSPTTYSVTITDALGCTAQTAVTITQPNPLASSSVITNVSCFGGSDGSIAITPVDGTAPYTYLWKPGNQTTSPITGQAQGTYTVTITDLNGCTLQKTNTITEPTALSLSLTSTDVSCFGGSNGTINSTVSGGTSSYSYNWTSGATAPNLIGLQDGTYSLTVTDSKGCTNTKSVVIAEPAVLTVTTTISNIGCNGQTNGTATAIPSGGTVGYTYLWQPGAKTTSTITNLSAGTYTVSVTDSKGCSVIAFATIIEPAVLAVGFVSQTNVNCFGGNNGSVTANPSGGTPNYTYAWLPGGATTSTRPNLTAGTYSVTITDSKGCTANNTVTLTQPTQLTVSTTKTNETCTYLNDGTATAIPSGGTSGYTYLWQPGALTSITITGLSSATYSLTTTDAKGCTASTTAVIAQPAVLAVSFSGQTNVSCFGGNNGAVTANPSGGTAGYTYSWLPGGTTTASVSSLIAGTYTVTVTDFQGCAVSNTVTITEPTQLSVNTSPTDETCDYSDNGSITSTVSGGTAAYTYLWKPSLQASSSITGLNAGTYSLTVTDSKGCTATSIAVVDQPTALLINFTGQINVSCFGGNDGAVSTSISGGTPNYNYSWSPGAATTNARINLTAGTYSLTITDANSCVVKNSVIITQPVAALAVSLTATNVSCFGFSDGAVSSAASGGTTPYNYMWMPGSLTAQNISNLIAGTYSLTVTDANGCTQTNSVNVTQPTQMTLTTSSVNSDCGQPNGQASVTVSGGSTPYTYLWSPTGGANATATALLAGTYTVTVTDNAGCTSSKQENVSENTAPVVSISSVANVNCNGGVDGSATVTLTGGTGPFTYSWSPSGGTNATATGLSAGFYTANVVDANGCKASATTTPSISEPPPIIITISTTPVSCFGGNDGTATASASGGTAGYTYQWLPSGTTGTSVSGLSATTYSVEVTDSKSCVQTQSFTVSQPSAPLAVSVSFDSVSCFGGSDGVVSAAASGGTAPYNYYWMPGNYNGQNVSNLPAGTYTVTVEDAKLCTITNTITVFEPTIISLSTGSPDSYCSLPNGQANVTASGGIPGYVYQWTPSGGTNATATGLLAGNYTVEVTDANACVSSASVTVLDQPGPIASVSSTTNVTCFGGSDGSATATFSGGTAPFTYLWSATGGTDLAATGLIAGTYTITITDANGCQSKAQSPDITQPTTIATVINKTMVSCFGLNDGAASVSASGSNPGYTYLWFPGGETTISINNLSATTYTVQVTDINNCVQSFPFTITEPALLTTVLSPIKNVSCFQGNDGEATAAVSGGTPVYSYQWSPIGGNGPVGSGFSANTYTVTVTDFNGCVSSASVSITQPAIPLSASGVGGSTSCFGGSDGTATINPVGGTPNYSYQWNPSGVTTQSATGLSAQNYFVLVTDNKGCQTNTSVVVTEPTAISGTLLPVSPSCGLSNGSISSQVSGGTSPYTYLWSSGSVTSSGITGIGPGTYTLQITDANNCTLSLTQNLVDIPGATVVVSNINPVSCFGGNDGSATINISLGSPPYSMNWLPYGGNNLTATSLVSGTYTVSVTDSLGCISSVLASVPQPSDISISISALTNVLCNGESTASITVSASGGTPNYSYSWPVIGASTSSVNNIAAGTYTVNVTDQNSCMRSISINITEPAVLLSSIGNAVDPICFGLKGSVSVVVTGGTIPYAYSWSTNPILTGSNENLFAGTYSVTVTDDHGCTTSNSVTLTEPTQVITTAGLDDTVCLGQSATLSATASGGAGNYYYAWQPTSVINSGTITLTPTGDTTYIVVGYDKIGCPGTPDTTTAYTYHLFAGDVNAIAISPICPGRNSVVSAQSVATTGPLTYQWNNNLGTGPGQFIVTPLQPTTYVVTANSSVCGTSIVDSVSVTFNPQPTIDLSSDTSALCVPGPIQFFDNSITGNISDPINSWNWNFGDGTFSTQQNPIHIFNQEGTYFVTLTVGTAGGCTAVNSTSPLTIDAHQYPTAAFTVNSPELNLPIEKLAPTNQSVGASTYVWNFGDGGTSTVFNPEYYYSSVGIFQIQLIATSQYDCSDTAYSQVSTTSDFVFPNAFTPNEDGPTGGGYDKRGTTNDVFFPYVSGVIKFKIEIFNRWGELIFESNDINIGWDGYYMGQLCQQDVYIWKAFLKLNNGKEYNKSGDVTLLR